MQEPISVIIEYVKIILNYIFGNLAPISRGKYKLPSCLSIIGSISSGLAIYSKTILKKAPPIPNPETIIPVTRPFLFGR